MTTLRKFLHRREAGPLIALCTLSFLFHLVSGGRFFTFFELSAVAALSASLGVVAVGVTILMISGEFDLSVSQTFALAPIVMGTLVQDYSWGAGSALLIAILVVMTVGLVNGLITTMAGIPSFIVTLGMMFAITTVNRTLIGGFGPDLYQHEAILLSLMGDDIPGTPLSAPLVWMLAVAGIMWFVLEWTPYGNWARASGDHGGRVARAMGVPVRRVKVVNFVICAGLAGFAGCLQLADSGSASVNSGQNYNLLAIVAVVIGGTSLFGVQGTVVGTVLGTLLLNTLKSGLILIGTQGQYYPGLLGALLVGAAIINARMEPGRRRG